MDRRCFWPPDTFVPPSAMGAWMPPGSFWTNSLAWARSSAWRTASSDASPRLSPNRTFSQMSPEKRIAFCVT